MIKKQRVGVSKMFFNIPDVAIRFIGPIGGPYDVEPSARIHTS